MRDIYLIENLCKNYCSYYKPSKKKELACRGYLVVREMIDKGKNLSFDRTDTPLDDVTVRILSGNLCPFCSFYNKDCDFAARIETAPPCGGFIFLGQLRISQIRTKIP